MINAQDVLSELSQTKRLLTEEMLKRGWQVAVYDPKLPLLRVTRSDGVCFDIHGASPPETSLVAASRADNKLVTQELYEKAELPVLDTFPYDDSGRDRAEKLLKNGEKLVIKPADSAHGNGVTIAIEAKEQLEKAAKLAGTFSESVIAQVYTPNQVDIRAICIDYKFQAALIRYPAAVVGDGSSTIEELIYAENKSERRGENYRKELNIINLTRAFDYLGTRKSEIPKKDERVQVIGTANVGSGGTTKDVTTQMPTWLVGVVEKAAKTSELPVAGVDLLISKEPQPSLSQKDLRPYIIETNANPSLFIHDKPTIGDAQPVTKTYVDYLERLQIDN